MDEDGRQKPVLSIRGVGSRDANQDFRLDSKVLNHLSHLTVPQVYSYSFNTVYVGDKNRGS